MKLGKISATIALLTMCIGTAGQAQSRQRHDGFWIGFGIGGGVNASANNDERGGGALSLRLGGTLSQKFLLGGEISAWRRQEDSALGGDPLTVTKSNATFMVMFFPSDAGGFFIKGGIGGANVEAESAGAKVTEQGVGNTLGLGYDIRLGSNLYLTPNLDCNGWGCVYCQMSHHSRFQWRYPTL